MIKKFKISKLFNIEKGALQSSKNTSGQYDFITASREWKTHKSYTHNCEALIIAVAASGSLGRVHYVNSKFTSSDLCFIITPKDKSLPLDLRFYYYIFLLFKEDLVYRTATGSAKKAINKTNFGKYELPYFDIETQKDFSKKLKSLSELKIELLSSFEEQKILVSKLRQSILQEAVQGKLTTDWRSKNLDIEPASELLERIKKEKEQLINNKKIKKEKSLPPIAKNEIPYELPNGWEWCRFKDCANIASNLVKPENFSAYPHVAPDVIEKNTGKLFEYRTVKEDGVTSFKHLFRSGHILYSKIRPNLNKLVIVDFAGLCSADMYPIDSFILTEYLFKYMLSNSFLNQSVKTDTRVAMPKINQTELNKIIISIPPLEEQKVIVLKVNELMAYCDQLEMQLIESKLQAEQLIQAVLKEVFTPRKKVVKDLFDSKYSYQELADLQQGMIALKTQEILGGGRGKVYFQKASANLKGIKEADIPYIFKKSNFGEFSWQLSEDIDKNPFLERKKSYEGYVYVVRKEKEQEVLKALNSSEYSSFVQNLDEMLNVYRGQLFKGITDRVELLNTVFRAIKDTKSIIGNVIYQYMREWKIEQKNFKTKADKFKFPETLAMIDFIVQKGWHKKVI